MEKKIAGGNRRALQVKAIGDGQFTKRHQKRFLDTLAATCNVRISAEAADKSLSSCYRLRARDAGFAEAWHVALGMGYERLEEALLDYALNTVGAHDIDPGAVDPEAFKGSVVSALANRTVSNADLQFAIGLLNRHRATVEGRRTSGRGAQRATAAETDAALRRKLDALSRQMKAHEGKSD